MTAFHFACFTSFSVSRNLTARTECWFSLTHRPSFEDGLPMQTLLPGMLRNFMLVTGLFYEPSDSRLHRSASIFSCLQSRTQRSL